MMTKEELIDLMGNGDKPKSIVVCESYEQSLEVGPLLEEIYEVRKTDWTCEGYFWKYMRLEGGSVNAYGSAMPFRESLRGAAQISGDEFLRRVQGVSDVAVDDLL